MCEIEDSVSKGLFELVGAKCSRRILTSDYLRLTMRDKVPLKGLSHYARF